MIYWYAPSREIIVKLLVFEMTFLNKDEHSAVLKVSLETAKPLISIYICLHFGVQCIRALTASFRIWNMDIIHVMILSNWNQIKVSVQENVFRYFSVLLNWGGFTIVFQSQSRSNRRCFLITCCINLSCLNVIMCRAFLSFQSSPRQ